MGELAQSARIAVDGGYLRAGPEQVGERQREGTLARPEIRPAASLGVDAVAKETDQVSVIHVR